MLHFIIEEICKSLNMSRNVHFEEDTKSSSCLSKTQQFYNVRYGETYVNHNQIISLYMDGRGCLSHR